ncbi:MAG: hypothetical protein JOS17DRAFT_747168 [Linnemannia elongata]|nr:MAG: hypothetical protein JOS17DRAFT_747168 [Linnemannia elongata]
MGVGTRFKHFSHPSERTEREPFGFRLYILLNFLLSTHQPYHHFTHHFPHPQSSTMRSSVFILTVTLALAASAFAAPQAEVVSGGDVQIEEVCRHPSKCASNWSGLCEDYCGDRGFSHMSSNGCIWFSKKCCCHRD